MFFGCEMKFFGVLPRSMTFIPKKASVTRSKISELYIKEHLKEENKIDSVHPRFSSLKYLSYLKPFVHGSIIGPLFRTAEYLRFNLVPRKSLLLVGAKNTGKRFFLKSVCVEYNVNFLESYVDNEKDVCNAYRKALDMEPCLLYLANQLTNEKEKVLHEIEKNMEKVRDKKILTIFSCQSKAFIAENVSKMVTGEVALKTPDENDRRDILASFSLKNFDNVDLGELAKLTPGYLPIDLHNLCVSAASSAIIDNRQVEINDFLRNLTNENKITLDNIGALYAVKKEIEMNILLPLQFPEKFKRMGISRTSGILLYGPPGCGKTMLARAIANTLFCNFISVRGPELVNKYVGDTEKEMREVFNRARNQEPCVLFFDEIDSLCSRRTDNDFQTRIVNQMLTLLDGIDDKGKVFIVGATNRMHALDSAILRPGRFDKIIEVPLPTREEQIDILRKCVRNMPIEPFDLEEIDMDGFTGADIAGLVRESALFALKNDFMNEKLVVGKNDFLAALRDIKRRKQLFG
ncbi:vesicle-fusing ATPase, adenosinetriphosphatase [Trachipleistophora hominis]|uniref:Vesicle-fusing ATPase, adenosinetriphosphatase n=1 Tax=Trachipleistophora hominis TaxID=72359 RepID=L7JSN1_TRAHO|nr:vesicle-fusing ATPase, adenosinetriphosphatase [Trachipleistophora hominis]